MSESKNSGSFAQAFLPGLILGLVIGAVAGAFLPDFFGGPAIPPPNGEAAGAYDERREEGAPMPSEYAEEIIEPANPDELPGGIPTDPQPLPDEPPAADPAPPVDQP